jgi:DNA-binding transcriptional ArsR family regulator
MKAMDQVRQAELFKVLSVESRIKIIDLLKQKGPLGVNELSEELGITPSAVSQHLKVLRYAGLVRSERKGYWLPYEIDPAALEKCGELISGVCACGCQGSCRGHGDNLSQLKQYEKELKKELKRVLARIKELESRK